MTDDDKEMMKGIIRDIVGPVLTDELHHINNAHGTRKTEQLITWTGIFLTMVCLMVPALVAWAIMPPLLAEIVKAKG